MYLPEHFKVDDVSRMHALMRERPFATLISSGSLGLFATHLPVVLKTEGPPGSAGLGAIECHLARANPHWRDLAQTGTGTGAGTGQTAVAEALMIFHGPEGYITPNWYASKPETEKVVPTWNYAAVHAYGRPAIMDGADWMRRHVAELTDQRERRSADQQPGSKPWALSDAPEDYVQAMMRGIVGFRFEITRLEGKWKMSQNRETRDRSGVVAGLSARGHGDDAAIAALVSGAVPQDL